MMLLTIKALRKQANDQEQPTVGATREPHYFAGTWEVENWNLSLNMELCRTHLLQSISGVCITTITLSLTF
jgi:hypothetical protein